MPISRIPEPRLAPRSLRPSPRLRTAAARLARGVGAGALAALLGLLGSLAASPPARAASHLGEDDQLGALLRRADELIAERRPRDAAIVLLRAEERVEAATAEDPTARPVVPGPDGVWRSADLEIQRRVLLAGPDALVAYRAARAPRVRELAAQAAADPFDPRPLRDAARYRLVEDTGALLVRLGDLCYERGELGAAGRAYQDALEPQAGVAPLGEALARVAEAALARIDGASADRPLVGWPTLGGGPDRARSLAEAPLPGALADEVALPTADLSPVVLQGLTRRGVPAPLPFRPVTDGQRVYVADSKAVMAIDLATSRLAWVHVASDPEAPPGGTLPEGSFERASAVALGQGRVFAALDRNTQPVYDPAAPAPKKGEQAAATRARDWRLVALDAATGGLVWDAALDPALGELCRDARSVSAPLFAHGAVFYAAVDGRGSDLRAWLVALDAVTGRLRFRVFLCSASADNFLDQSAAPAPPAAAHGLVFVQTNLGVVAALDPLTGQVAWAHGYRALPIDSQKRALERGQAFGPTAPLVLAGVVVATPRDSVAVLGLDARTGRERFRLARGGLRQVLGAARGRVVLAGEVPPAGVVVVALDPTSGRVAWHRALPGSRRLVGSGIASERRILVSVDDRLVALDAADGRIEDICDQEGGGNLAAAGGRLLQAGARTLRLFEERSRSLERLAAAAAEGDPNRRLAYARLLGAVGRHEEALALLDRTAGGDPEVLAAARFRIARRAAQASATRGEDARALAFELRGAERPPLTAEAAGALIGLARRLVDAGRGAEAVDVLGRLARDFAGVVASLPSAVEVDAAAYARDRLRELRGRLPADAFAAFDGAAARAFGKATAGEGRDGLERVARAFPSSRYEGMALLSLAAQYEERELWNQAARALEEWCWRGFDRAATADEALSVLLRRAQLYLKTRRVTDEAAVLEEVERRFGDERVGASGEPLRVFVSKRRALLARAARVPPLPGGGDPAALGRLYQTWPDLGAEEPRLIAPPGYDPAIHPFVLVASERSLEARAPETGGLLWRWETPRATGEAAAGALDPELNHRRVVLAEGAVVFAYGRVVEALDAVTGQRRWQHAAEDLCRLLPGEGPRPPRLLAGWRPRWPIGAAAVLLDALARGPRLIDPDPIRGIAAAGPVVLAVVPAGVVAVEAGSGRIRWRAERAERLSGSPLIAPGGGEGGAVALVWQEAPAVLIGLEVASGKERYATRPGEREPRLTIAPQAGQDAPERAFFVVDGNQLARLHVGDGSFELLRKLPFWPRELAAEPEGRAVCVIPHRGPGQPAAAVFDGRTGEQLSELDADPAQRVNRAAFGDDDLYLLAGDYRDASVHALEWKTGRVRWTWTPQRGTSLQDVVLTRDHLVLARTAARPGRVFAIDRELGRVHRTFETPGRRVVNALCARGVLVVSTNRGVQGYGRIDVERLLDEEGTLAAALDRAPGDAAVAGLLAHRLFQRGEVERAVRTLERALDREGLGEAEHAALGRQLLGYLDAAETGPTIELGPLGDAPLIDGELSDPWPLEQSFALAGARHVAPVQGQGPAGRLAVLRGDDDLSAVLYTGYDARYFYFALDVTDSTLVPYDSEADDWKGDCLLMAIDSLGNGGDYFDTRDDNLLSLALALPRKKKKDPAEEEEERQDEPDGKFFVKRKEDGSGAVYEAAIPWQSFRDRGATIDPVKGPEEGFTFGFNVILTDADEGAGSRQGLSWTPAVWLHREKAKLWEGLTPARFVQVKLRGLPPPPPAPTPPAEPERSDP